jgi:phage gp29-like protein
LDEQLPALSLESLEPATRAYRTWTPALLKRAEQLAEAGNLTLAADLCEQMFADDRVKAVLDTRTDALLGLRLSFEASLDGRKGKKAIAALEAGEDWWASFPETTIKELHAWGLMLGVGLAEIVWEERAEHDGRVLPRLVVKDPRNLRYDWRTRKWFLRVASANDNGGTSEIEVNPGDGRWLMYTPYGSRRPWRWGAYRALSRWCLLKIYAINDWGFYSNRHGIGILVATAVKGDEKARKAVAAELRKLGRNSAVPLPEGTDLKLLEATAKTYETFTAQIAASDNGAAVCLLGQNLTTQAGNASGTSATVHGRVALGRTKADVETLSTCLHGQVLVYWAAFNFGSRKLAPWPVWDATPTADLKERASVIQMAAQGIGGLLASGVITIAEARDFIATFGFKLGERLAEAVSKAPIFAYHIAAGIVTINEVRKDLGLPPLADGNQRTGAPAAPAALAALAAPPVAA